METTLKMLFRPKNPLCHTDTYIHTQTLQFCIFNDANKDDNDNNGDDVSGGGGWWC